MPTTSSIPQRSRTRTAGWRRHRRRHAPRPANRTSPWPTPRDLNALPGAPQRRYSLLILRRRHLSDGQRAMVAASIVTMRQGERTALALPANLPKVSQSQAAADVGLSRRQAVTAVRVANVPGDLFEGVDQAPTRHAQARPPAARPGAESGTRPARAAQPGRRSGRAQARVEGGV